MQEYLYSTGSSGDEYKDVFSEIDAGELDEQYLIKHAGDYGKRTLTHPLGMLKTLVASLLNLLMRSSRPNHAAPLMKTRSHSATQ